MDTKTKALIAIAVIITVIIPAVIAVASQVDDYRAAEIAYVQSAKEAEKAIQFAEEKKKYMRTRECIFVDKKLEYHYAGEKVLAGGDLMSKLQKSNDCKGFMGDQSKPEKKD